MSTGEVVDILREGRILRRFLRVYGEGARGAPLIGTLRRAQAFKGLSDEEFNQIYRTYLTTAESGARFAELSAAGLLEKEQIGVNPYLSHFDRIQDRYSYFVKVSARVGGEESVHTRIVRVTNPNIISQGELANRLAPEFGKFVYTEQGILAAKSGLAIEFTEVEFVGVSRLF